MLRHQNFDGRMAPALSIRIAFPREKRENKEFYDEEFITRKTDEKNEELTSLK